MDKRIIQVEKNYSIFRVYLYREEKDEIVELRENLGFRIKELAFKDLIQELKKPLDDLISELDLFSYLGIVCNSKKQPKNYLSLGMEVKNDITDFIIRKNVIMLNNDSRELIPEIEFTNTRYFIKGKHLKRFCPYICMIGFFGQKIENSNLYILPNKIELDQFRSVIKEDIPVTIVNKFNHKINSLLENFEIVEILGVLVQEKYICNSYMNLCKDLTYFKKSLFD